MGRRDIIAIGASAGGLEALGALMPHLPADLHAALFITVHRTGRVDFLAQVLGRNAKVSVATATDGSSFTYGRAYVAPPQTRLLFEKERIRLAPCTDANPVRQNVNNLFRSAALTFGDRVIAVLLSGRLDDGTAGLWDVRRHGGVTITQDPAEAKYASMPQSGMNEIPVHYCLSIPEIAATVVRLCGERATGPPAHPARVLIVEDEAIVAMNLSQRLRDLGYVVVGAVATAEEALKLVPTLSPDVALVDVQLAGAMKGTQAARILWKRFKLPVVFVTAYSDEATLADASASMPAAFIVKPYRVPQVHAAIRLALDRRERKTLA